MTAGINLTIIIICIILQGFFSGCEMVLLSSDKIKLRRKNKKKSAGARLALSMIANPRWFLATTSTGTNTAVIISSVIAAVWFESIFGTFGELMTIVIMSPILLMFGEILPRTIFQQRATQAAPKIARPFWVISHIISPVTFLVFSVSKLFYRRVGSESIEKNNFATREELELILNIPGQGSDVKKKEKKLISRVFNLAESNVADVMVPLINVTAISHTSVVKNAITVIRKTGFSRLPVYKDRIDNIIGIVHTFDLIDIRNINAPIQEFIKQAPFVPEFKRADDLLISMQKARNTIAVVVDEYGGAAGIITVEDILEEVVGEIRDEYDRGVFNLKKLRDKQFLLNARMEIEHINEQLNINIPKEDYETLGGFLLKRMGKVPQKEEVYIFEKIKFTIKRSTKRSVLDVLVELP
jgi:putative hemolysin